MMQSLYALLLLAGGMNILSDLDPDGCMMRQSELALKLPRYRQ
jgi:hypothetical protein